MNQQPSTTLDSTAPAVITTLLVTDLVDSTRLVTALGDRRTAKAWARHDRLVRDMLPRFKGQEIDKSDGFLLLFDRPIDASRYALAYHEALVDLSKELDVSITARAGIHVGEVVLRKNKPEDVARGAKPVEVEGLAKVMAARVMSLAQGGQTLLTRSAFDLARRASVGEATIPPHTRWMDHGPYRLKGVDEPLTVCEVGLEGRAPLAPPPNTEKVKRAIAPGDEETLGWRPAAGQMIPGRRGWKLERKLGEGGFGEVWLVRHKRTRNQRTFKFCFRADRLRTLKRELTLFRLMKEVLGDRPDIVRLYDVQLEEAPYFLEMEYVSGGNLADWAQVHGGISHVAIETLLELVAQIAEALAAAHSVGVIHKDVKPTNVLIQENKDGTRQARLIDFGIGQLITPESLEEAGITKTGFTDITQLTDLGSRTGTRIYMAPELATGKPISIQSDIYALGVILYQLVVADFTRPLAQGWESGVDDELLRDDIAACIAGSPDDRLPSADILAKRLRTLKARRVKLEAERSRVHRERRLRRLVKAGAISVGVLALVIGAMIMWSQRTKLGQAKARDVLAMLVHDPTSALEELGRAGGSVRKFYTRATVRQLSSSAFTERIMGVRGTLWRDPQIQQAFWTSVDGGPVWEYGEWLELCRVQRTKLPELMRRLAAKARGGTNREKYVAFCLMGELAESPGDLGDLVDLCVRAMETEPQPGVVAAAHWVASRIGQDVPYRTGKRILADDISGLVFVRLPSTEDFRPGSPPDDPYRYADEDRPKEGVRIDPNWISATEVTLSQMERFLPWLQDTLLSNSTGKPALAVLKPQAKFLSDQLKDTDASRRASTAVYGISPVMASLFCKWLNQETDSRGIPAWYRLPTEEEWEYACRGGNAHAFCYGENPQYARYFASCGGSEGVSRRTVATRMPNFYGLFDMHGNVWEICDTVYRESYDDPKPDPETADPDSPVVQRGGAIYSPTVRCRSAQRNYVKPTVAGSSAGFRIVLEKEPKP